MNKVLVLGCSGSGKSTFSKLLGQKHDLPVIHLDSLYWKSGWVPANEEDWDQTIGQLMEQDRFIMDGNYSRTLDVRLRYADTVYYFDFPRYLCLYRVFKRRIQNHGKTREDMALGCNEKIDLEFIKWIWNFNKRNRTSIMNRLEEAKEHKQIYIFRTPRDVENYMINCKS